MIRQLYEIGMRVRWSQNTQEKEKTPIGVIRVHDAGVYRLFTTETFHLCYKILKTESSDELHQVESALQMPEEWVPFRILTTEEYPLYSLTPSLQFGSWSLQYEEDSQSFSETLPSSPRQGQQRPTSRQSSLQQPRPFVKQVQPSSQSHQRLHQYHSKQRQPALKSTSTIVEKQKGAPSSNQTFHGQHQSQHQSRKERPNEPSVPSDQISLQSQWIPLERLSHSPSSQPSPRQKVTQQQQDHVSGHRSTESKHLHGRPTSHQQKSKHQRRHHVPDSQGVPEPQKPMN